MRESRDPSAEGNPCAPILAGLVAVFAASFAHANISTAELTTGGLALAKTADIEMRAEDSAVSEKQIDVHYRFFNHSAQDVTATVAFPMPDIAWEGPDTNIAVPVPDSPNFLDFHTFVDGREVAAQNEQKAFAGGLDVSARLQALGISLAPQRDSTWAALDALPPAQQDELVKSGIATPNDYDAGKGMEHHLAPNWTLKSSFFWRQTFPAGKRGRRRAPLPSKRRRDRRHDARLARHRRAGAEPLRGALLRRQRVPRRRGAAARKPTRAALVRSPFFERRIAYVLSTGANWAGPIGDFHLTVDKGAPDRGSAFAPTG